MSHSWCRSDALFLSWRHPHGTHLCRPLGSYHYSKSNLLSQPSRNERKHTKLNRQFTFSPASSFAKQSCFQCYSCKDEKIILGNISTSTATFCYENFKQQAIQQCYTIRLKITDEEEYSTWPPTLIQSKNII